MKRIAVIITSVIIISTIYVFHQMNKTKRLVKDEHAYAEFKKQWGQGNIVALISTLSVVIALIEIV